MSYTSRVYLWFRNPGDRMYRVIARIVQPGPNEHGPEIGKANGRTAFEAVEDACDAVIAAVEDLRQRAAFRAPATEEIERRDPDFEQIDTSGVHVRHYHDAVVADIVDSSAVYGDFEIERGEIAADATGSPYVVGHRTYSTLEIVERLRGGDSLSRIAKTTGAVNASHVRNIGEIHGVIGDSTAARNREIRARFAAGHSRKQLAEDFGMVAGRIQQITAYT